MSEFDPVKQGILWEKVDALEKKIVSMENDIKTLLLLAERGRGTLFAVMAISSVVGGIFTLTVDWFKK